MSIFSDLKARMGSLLAGRRADHELTEELSHHLEESARRYEARGHSPAEARRLARLALGRVTQTVEDTRDARGVRFIEDLGRDLRHAARQLRRTPGFTAAAVLTLALGVGATTAMFSVVEGVLLRPLPFAEPDRLVMVWHTDRNSGTSHEPSSWPDYVDIGERATTLAGVAAFRGIAGSLAGPAEAATGGTATAPVRIAGIAVTHNYFSLLGIRPIGGRTFTAEEDTPGGPRVVLVSESYWRRSLGADPSLIGRAQIRINEEPHTIIGILPAEADFALDQIHQRADYHPTYVMDGPVDAWLPYAADPGASRDSHPTLMLGRLAPGATIAAAQADVARVMSELEAEYPRSNEARGVNIEALDRVVFGAIRPLLGLLLGAVALVLIVACVNVANLLLARGATRAGEVAVRGALGAGQARLGRQFLTESLLLAGAGAVVGVGLAWLGLDLLIGLVPEGAPRVESIAIDPRVLAGTLVVTVAVGLGFGMVPTLQARRIEPMTVITGEGRSGAGSRNRTRFREALVVAELALSVALVVSAGLLGRSLWAALSVDPGFNAGVLAKASFQLPAARYPIDFSRWPNLPEVHAFYARVLERARQVPGVTSVAVAAEDPFDRGSASSFRIVGREAESRGFPEIPIRRVSPSYFATTGLRLVAGRLLGDGDDWTAPRVALVNQVAAERYFGGTDPIGQEIRFWGQIHRIVGIVGNERFHGLTEEAPPATYLTVGQAPGGGGVLLARTSGDPAGITGALRQVFVDVDPELAVWGAEPMSRVAARSLADRRFAATLIGVFALVTIVLALVGIHGVISYATTQRSQEIGIRVALGATGGQVAGMVVRRGARLALLGTVLGIAAAAAGGRLLERFLFGVGGLDPLTFTVVPAVMLLAATAAVLLPARRAARAQPIEALRGAQT